MAEDYDQLIRELLGYGVDPQQLASLPMIPQSYVDSVWDQDAGTYVDKELTYGKPSTRLWHGQTLLDQILSPQLAILGGAYGVPGIDYMQDVEEAQEPIPTPFADYLAGSSDQYEAALGEDLQSGLGVSAAKDKIRTLYEEGAITEGRQNDLLAFADRAFDEQLDAASETAARAAGGGSDKDLSPVEEAYREAGVTPPWVTYEDYADPESGYYSPEVIEAEYTPKTRKQISKREKQGNRFLKSVDRFMKDVQQRRDDALTGEEKGAVNQAVEVALKSLNLFGGGKDSRRLADSRQGVGNFVQAQGRTPTWRELGFEGNWVDNIDQGQGEAYDPTFAGGSPEAHAQIAQDLAAYQQQSYENDRRKLAARRLTEQGRTPSSDEIRARVALTRFLGIPA